MESSGQVWMQVCDIQVADIHDMGSIRFIDGGTPKVEQQKI